MCTTFTATGLIWGTGACLREYAYVYECDLAPPVASGSRPIQTHLENLLFLVIVAHTVPPCCSIFPLPVCLAAHTSTLFRCASPRAL